MYNMQKAELWMYKSFLCHKAILLIFLQLLIIQACQGETTPAGGDCKVPNLDSASESSTEVASIDVVIL